MKWKRTCRQTFELPWLRKQATILHAPLASRLAATILNAPLVSGLAVTIVNAVRREFNTSVQSHEYWANQKTAYTSA